MDGAVKELYAQFPGQTKLHTPGARSPANARQRWEQPSHREPTRVRCGTHEARERLSGGRVASGWRSNVRPIGRPTSEGRFQRSVRIRAVPSNRIPYSPEHQPTPWSDGGPKAATARAPDRDLEPIGGPSELCGVRLPDQRHDSPDPLLGVRPTIVPRVLLVPSSGRGVASMPQLRRPRILSRATDDLGRSGDP